MLKVAAPVICCVLESTRLKTILDMSFRYLVNWYNFVSILYVTIEGRKSILLSPVSGRMWVPSPSSPKNFTLNLAFPYGMTF